MDETKKAKLYTLLSCNEDGQHRYVLRHRHGIEIDGCVIQNWCVFDRRLERWLFDVDVDRISAEALQERMLNG